MLLEVVSKPKDNTFWNIFISVNSYLGETFGDAPHDFRFVDKATFVLFYAFKQPPLAE